jgi:hypothetical protein
MSKFEINRLKGIFFMRDIDDRVKYVYPCGLNFIDKLWWWFVPGVIINVKWPSGEIVAGPGPADPRWRDWGGAAYVRFYSADPNDHYRPWLEQHVGKQRWDWQWGMADRDATDNRLTIKIRQKYSKYATIAALQWS